MWENVYFRYISTEHSYVYTWYISRCVQNQWHFRNFSSISQDLEKCLCVRWSKKKKNRKATNKCSLFVQLLIFKPQSGFILSREAVIVPVRNDAIPQSKCLIEDVRGFKINVLRCCMPRVHTHRQQCYPVNGSVDFFFYPHSRMYGLEIRKDSHKNTKPNLSLKLKRMSIITLKYFI